MPYDSFLEIENNLVSNKKIKLNINNKNEKDKKDKKESKTSNIL